MKTCDQCRFFKLEGCVRAALGEVIPPSGHTQPICTKRPDPDPYPTAIYKKHTEPDRPACDDFKR